MRRLVLGFVFISILLLFGRGEAWARAIRQGDQCIIDVSETIQGNLFTLCRTLQIRGTVNGDVLGASTDAQITGKVTGDVYMVAGQLEISGEIGEDVHFAGAVLRLLPSAKLSGETSDLMTLSLSTTVDSGTTVPGNITAAGYQLVLNGPVGGEVSFWGSGLTINTTVGADVDAVVGDSQSTGGWDVELSNPGLTVSDKGVIGGHLKYSAVSPGIVTGKVVGDTVFTKVSSQPDLTQMIQNENQDGVRLLAGATAHEFAILVLIGIIAMTFLPRQFQIPLRTLQSRTLPSAGVGLLAFIISFPITIVMLILIVLVLIVPLMILQLDGLFVFLFGGTLIGAWSGAASIFYFTAIFVSRVVVALMIGKIIVRGAIGDDGSQRIAFISLFLGIFLLSVLVSLPVVGIIVSAVTAFMGLGAILIVVSNQMRALRDSIPTTSLRMNPLTTARRTDTRSLPPPIVVDDGPEPGMDNLPPGFEWWDD
jgi:cytoskeletal protein CcmA (bactofilin family)